jgi:glycosyltransferase involved in cell wall biosynthesis
MRIAIDTHAIGSNLTGNERYIQNLAEHLLELDGENQYFFFFSREEVRRRWENRAPNLHTYLVSQNPFRRLGFDFISQLRKLRPQVFHYQYTGPLLRLTPEIVTIHDVSFERHPEFFDPVECFRLKLTVRRAAKLAQRIITVSEFSKAEIVHFLGVPEQKVKVIYNGVGPEFQPIEDQDAILTRVRRYPIRRPYLLAVGNICRRKNYLAMVRGFALWLSRQHANEHQLVIVGKPQGHLKELLAEASRLGLDESRLTLVGFVPEEDLAYLYAGAELFLNTSLYEGFGLPIIEAMRCGVPVVASHASCFPEIAGDAARYVDPGDAEAIAEAIEEVLGSETLRNELVDRGLHRAPLFRWDATARETLKVYYEAADSARHSHA